MQRDKSIYEKVAKRLREHREAAGLTRSQVAERLGVDTPRYSYWEKSFGPLPQRQYGDAIARILGVDFGQLVSGAGETLIREPIDRTALGERAAERRRTLKLSRAKVAEAAGVSGVTLSKWEESLPELNRGEKEGHWEDALQVPRGWLRNPGMIVAESSLPSHASLDLTFAGNETVTDEIRSVGAWLARTSARARTVRFEELTGAERRRAQMFAERYGVVGSEGAVLQSIGDRFGLTRERVRQVVDVMITRSGGVTFVLPHLSQLKEAAVAATAVSVAEFEAVYRPLLGPLLSLADADSFAREILGFGVATITERSLWQSGNAIQPMLAGGAGVGIAVAVRDSSRRMIRSCGAAHVLFVTGMVSETLGEAVSVSDVRQALAAVEGMEWLTADEDWYWFGVDTANNRALDVARKALAVAGRRLDIEELHQAVCRSRRPLYEDRKSPPAIEAPKHVLREIFARVPWMTIVQFDDFALTEPIRVEEALNSSELAVAETIRRYGGAVARQVLNKEFVLAGKFSGPNLQVILSGSPIIRPLGFGIYGLRGVAVSEKAFAKAMASVGNAVVVPSQLDSGGWCEFELEMTEFKLRNGLVDFPSRVIKAIPAGEYLAKGLAAGKFVVGMTPSAPNRVTKLMPLLRKAGVAAGDVLRIRIHPESLRAELSRACE